jgi:hypothetical protein
MRVPSATKPAATAISTSNHIQRRMRMTSTGTKAMKPAGRTVKRASLAAPRKMEVG